MPRTVAALLLALTALPGCVIAAGEGETEVHWLDEDSAIEIGGLHREARLDHLKVRIAALEEHMAHCSTCCAAAQAQASSDEVVDSPFVYDMY